MNSQQITARLAQRSDSRIVLLVLDGVGDIRTSEQPRTALEQAETPNLDALAARSALGRLVPVATGVTPGSGPGHLALFGYDPTTPEADIGRGVLEALGLGLEIRPGDVVARGNFATMDASGLLTDRRAGRIATDECIRLCSTIQSAFDDYDDIEIRVEPGEEHRFVLILSGDELSPWIADTDPQRVGLAALAPQALKAEADPTAHRLAEIISVANSVLVDEEKANCILLRGVSELPDLPDFTKIHQLRAGAFAGYPLYRGVAAACGMEVVPCGKQVEDVIDVVGSRWIDFDFFFMHIKQTDKAGEDGNLAKKIAVVEQVDAALPRLLDLGPTVLAITGDHSTPVPMAAHSWHPVPLLVSSPVCFVDDCREFSETLATAGHLGTFPAVEMMSLLLANAGRLAKFGA
jgi:2,3-bisphosphoglycerate-independent phosphoglycerate mutase